MLIRILSINWLSGKNLIDECNIVPSEDRQRTPYDYHNKRLNDTLHNTINETCACRCYWTLTHWGGNKMTAIYQTTCIFLNKNVWIMISLKFVHKGQINNIRALVQIMAWRRPGDKRLSEPMMVNLQTHYASLGFNELTITGGPFYWHIHVLTKPTSGLRHGRIITST